MSNDQSSRSQVRKVVPYKPSKRVSTVRKLNLDFAGTALEQALFMQSAQQLTDHPVVQIDHADLSVDQIDHRSDQSEINNSTSTLEADSGVARNNDRSLQIATVADNSRLVVDSTIEHSSTLENHARVEHSSTLAPDSIIFSTNKPVNTIPQHLNIETVSPVANNENLDISAKDAPGTTHAHHSTLAPISSVANTAGHTIIPNHILDGLCPLLPPLEQVIYLRLYRLSHGFHKDTCQVGLERLAKSCNMSSRQVFNCIDKLKGKSLIQQIRTDLGNPNKAARGNVYRVLIPQANKTTLEPHSTLEQYSKVASNAKVEVSSTFENNSTSENNSTHAVSSSIKDHDHDLLKKDHLKQTMTAYQLITGNNWSKADNTAYEKIIGVSVDKITQTLREVMARAPQKPVSLAYFVKEILNPIHLKPDSKSAIKAKLRIMIDRLSQANVGRHYTLGELAEDTKLACARDGIHFDNDLFNEIIASRTR